MRQTNVCEIPKLPSTKGSQEHHPMHKQAVVQDYQGGVYGCHTNPLPVRAKELCNSYLRVGWHPDQR
jgi:hypothetical protein